MQTSIFPKKFIKLCQVAGVKISRFVAEAVEEKLQKWSKKKKAEFEKM